MFKFSVCKTFNSISTFKELIDANINSFIKWNVDYESTSKLPINNVEFCLHTSSANWNESLTVYSFLVKEFNMETKDVASLNVGDYKADKIDRNGGHPSSWCLCTLQSPYIVLGLVQTGFTDLRISFDILLDLTRYMNKVSVRFSSLTTKFRKLHFLQYFFQIFFDHLIDFSFS